MKEKKLNFFEKRILYFIRARSKNNPILAKELEFNTGLKNREVRETVRRLRLKGFPVCSGQEGFYYAHNVEEVRDTIMNLNSRAREIQKVSDALTVKWFK